MAAAVAAQPPVPLRLPSAWAGPTSPRSTSGAEVTSLRAAAQELQRLTQAAVQYICQVDEWLLKEREQLALERARLPGDGSSAEPAPLPPFPRPAPLDSTPVFTCTSPEAGAPIAPASPEAAAAAAALHDELEGADVSLRQLRDCMKELETETEVSFPGPEDSGAAAAGAASSSACGEGERTQSTEAPEPLLVLWHTNFQRPSGEWVMAKDLRPEGGEVLLGPGGAAVFTKCARKSAREERDVVRMRMRLGDNVVLPNHELLVEGTDGQLQGAKAGELQSLTGPLPRLYDGVQFQHILEYEVLRELSEVVEVTLDDGGAGVLLAWTMRKSPEAAQSGNEADGAAAAAAGAAAAAPGGEVAAAPPPTATAPASAEQRLAERSAEASTPVVPFREGTPCIPLSLLYACSLPVPGMDLSASAPPLPGALDHGGGEANATGSTVASSATAALSPAAAA